MPTAEEKVFNITELLELILLNVKPRDILVNVQKVSKRWKEVIEGSYKIQQALFFRVSPESLTEEPYTKNELLPLGHSLYLDVEEFTPRTWRPQPVWLMENASWRMMQISAPPVKTIHWQVHRLEKDAIPGIPGTLVDLEFPDGLRMGDLYDLLVGTRGEHYIAYPALEGGLSSCPLDLKEAIKQFYANQWDDSLRMELSVFQQVRAGDKVQTEGLDLQKYYQNLRKLVKVDVTEEASPKPWERRTLSMQRASAMVEFLKDAQNPIEGEA
ncbi:hypothetical protein F5Y06DRAFT_305653 [Hypoxylon sp. FL0890]|nr:hypothetical protein F5Y06DRAFT_305653 [Hypoxylon sp. FL0890]